MRLKTGIFLLSCVRCFSRITATVFFTTPADKLDRTCLTRRSWNERRRLTRKQPRQSSIFQATRKYSLRDGTAIYHQRRMPFAFASIYWKSGTWVLAAAAFATIGKSLQSEAFQRAMIYELNTFPWKYEARHPTELVTDSPDSSPLITTAMIQACFFALVLLGFAAALIALFASRRRRTRQLYDPIKEMAQVQEKSLMPCGSWDFKRNLMMML